MLDLKKELADRANSLGLSIYPKSADEAEETACAVVRGPEGKRLAVLGRETARFSGEAGDGLLLCPLTANNAKELMRLFPYTKPQSHRGHPFSIGLGDRLGLATPGHVRAIAGFDVFPVFAQQSIRELKLTGRSFSDVIASAAFGVFQEGYRAATARTVTI